MSVTSPYQITIETLKSMDDKQLVGLFHDIKDIQLVQRIADCAYHFTENYDYASQEDYDRLNGKSDEQDWKEQDDLQRRRDINSV